MRRLIEYDWPGNVRELENTIERAMVLTDTPQIGVEALTDRIGQVHRAPVPTAPVDEGDLSIKRASRRAEEELIRKALVRTAGNRTRAAELLEISHRALLYKIKEYGIRSGRPEADTPTPSPLPSTRRPGGSM